MTTTYCTTAPSGSSASRAPVYLSPSDRGGQITIGSGGADFTPVDTTPAGIGGCTAADVDVLTSRRAGSPTVLRSHSGREQGPRGGG